MTCFCNCLRHQPILLNQIRLFSILTFIHLWLTYLNKETFVYEDPTNSVAVNHIRELGGLIAALKETNFEENLLKAWEVR